MYYDIARINDMTDLKEKQKEEVVLDLEFK